MVSSLRSLASSKCFYFLERAAQMLVKQLVLMQMFGMDIDDEDTFENTEDMLEWARELTWYIDRGLEMVSNNRLKVVDWSLFYEYIAREYDSEFFEFLFEGGE